MGVGRTDYVESFNLTYWVWKKLGIRIKYEQTMMMTVSEYLFLNIQQQLGSVLNNE